MTIGPKLLDPKDYEIKWLEERNEQLRHRIMVLEEQLGHQPVGPFLVDGKEP